LYSFLEVKYMYYNRFMYLLILYSNILKSMNSLSEYFNLF